MKLSELEPYFLKREPDGSSTRDCSFEEADGIIFLCPKCFETNKGEVGTHSVICWQPHVPPNVDPKPGRWKFEGTGIEDLTLVAGSSSILLLGGCRAHFFIEQGKVRMA